MPHLLRQGMFLFLYLAWVLCTCAYHPPAALEDTHISLHRHRHHTCSRKHTRHTYETMTTLTLSGSGVEEAFNSQKKMKMGLIPDGLIRQPPTWRSHVLSFCHRYQLRSINEEGKSINIFYPPLILFSKSFSLPSSHCNWVCVIMKVT